MAPQFRLKFTVLFLEIVSTKETKSVNVYRPPQKIVVLIISRTEFTEYKIRVITAFVMRRGCAHV